MSILLPLYVWPGDAAWGPLYNALDAHPNVNFTVIVNPQSGPGSGELPDSAYLTEVPKLNTYDNVRTIGYVKTGYATNDLNLVLSQIHTYATWASKGNDPKLGIDGIFFDETPNAYDSTQYEYLKTISQAVKNDAGFASDKLVVLNPGTSSSYTDLSDISVEFEKSYAEWSGPTGLSGLKTAGVPASKVAVVMYSASDSVLDTVVQQTEGVADYVFITSDGQAEAYEGFSPIFADMVASLDK